MGAKMKATIDSSGTLRVTAETELESYALQQWADSAFINTSVVGEGDEAFWRCDHLIVDWSADGE